MQTILTGFKPTGHLHVGNYIGALRPLLELTRAHPQAKILCLVADMHALNTHLDPKLLAEYTDDLLRMLISMDTDNRLIIYRSSRVAQIGQMAQILSNYLGKGYLNRAHAYMVKAQENEQANRPIDDGVNMGLFGYPLLMAADILAVGADLVPVGHDQAQHLEIAQQLVTSVHARFGEKILAYPKRLTVHEQSMPGLDGRKMSKSYDNVIPLQNPQRTKAVKKIQTDSTSLGDSKDPDACLIMQVYQHFATETEYAELEAKYQDGSFSYGMSKNLLAVAMDREFAVFDEPASRDIQARLIEGEQMARDMAQANLESIYKHIGL